MTKNALNMLLWIKASLHHEKVNNRPEKNCNFKSFADHYDWQKNFQQNQKNVKKSVCCFIGCWIQFKKEEKTLLYWWF